MNIELTKEQSQKGDEFLKKLLSDGALERQTVYDFFSNRDEAIVICKTLEKKGIIILNSPTYNDPFIIVVPDDGISTFLKNGGLTKIATDQEEQNLIRKKEEEIRNLTSENLKLQNKQLKRVIVYSIISFVAGAIVSNLEEILTIFD
ncbi:hypothetical protein QO206_13970 [Leeuwenhoekiella aequorea]|uniref:hypothetical protein n=1 Tax=Leeuwenhoekiella aequorea TaxID=283736 RepID=UPI00352DA1A3|tara:strand:- start:21954 stop:22394 length:441 start_codon:yes stop_codon:yes gene_type:complete